ncbi:MAG: PP2C family protein-serine/threonine phosphatase [Lachnospiraceae bacterium]|nr:PP2C family protein-serine/threonine phosphatase [Lachnospiraceae bacterium]
MQEKGIKNKTYHLRSSMAFNVIGAIVLLMILFGLISCLIGAVSFTNSLKKEYSTTTYHMADTAALLVNGDHLDDYLAGKENAEYEITKGRLDVFCETIHVSLVYVIQVDQSDYGRFVSIFNSVDNTVDDSSYTPWELGHKRDTTNDEYRRKYKELYEQKAEYETVYRIKTTDGQHPHITTMVPVKNSAGDVVAILCMQRPIRELRNARKPYMIVIAVSTVLLAVIGSLLAGAFLRKQFVNPVQRISNEATRFSQENTKGEELGNLSRIKEISNLAKSIDTMENDMTSYVENLTSVTAEKERIGTELGLARSIQENSLQSVFPAFPDRTDFDIYALMDPAREVGGDFYHFRLIDDDHLALIIGDVSGKGIPAALVMMVTNILTSDRMRMGKTPAETLTFVNKDICERNRASMFVTEWVGVLELSTGKLIASNAGHEYPVLQRADGTFELIKDKHGLVIGGLEDTVYTEYELQMTPGTKLFVYTDGVPEATDAEDKMFGTDRMLDALNAHPEASPEQVLKNMQQAVNDFVKDAEQFDDLTMLCVEYKGK